jgi:hypothetical protein
MPSVLLSTSESATLQPVKAEGCSLVSSDNSLSTFDKVYIGCISVCGTKSKESDCEDENFSNKGR